MAMVCIALLSSCFILSCVGKFFMRDGVTLLSVSSLSLFFFGGVIPGYTQCLLLTFCSGIILGKVHRFIYGTGDCTHVGCMQDKHFEHCTTNFSPDPFLDPDLKRVSDIYS